MRAGAKSSRDFTVIRQGPVQPVELLPRSAMPLWRRRTDQVLELEPLDLRAPLAALVPPPRMHLTRDHGVFAPHRRLRAAVTPAGRGMGAPQPPAGRSRSSRASRSRRSLPGFGRTCSARRSRPTRPGCRWWLGRCISLARVEGAPGMELELPIRAVGGVLIGPSVARSGAARFHAHRRLPGEHGPRGPIWRPLASGKWPP